MMLFSIAARPRARCCFNTTAIMLPHLAAAVSHVSRGSNTNVNTAETQLSLTHDNRPPMRTERTTQLNNAQWVLLC